MARKGRKFKLTTRQMRTMKKLKVDYAPLAHYRRVKLPDDVVPAVGRHRDRRKYLIHRDGSAKPWTGRPFPKQHWKVG